MTEWLILLIAAYVVGFIAGVVAAILWRKPQPQPPITLTFAGLKGTIHTMADYVVKDDQPDVPYSVTLGEVTDAEGNVIADPQGLSVEVTSSDPSVVELTPADDKSGSAHFGNPGQATVTANVKDANGNILATGSANFTVTTGDPASVSSVEVAFPDLTQVA